MQSCAFSALVSGRRHPLTGPCAWLGRDTVFRFGGHCVGCGAKTWCHDDSDDDRRGPFGEHTCIPLTAENFPAGTGTVVPPDVSLPRCGACWDDARRSREATRKAMTQLRKRGRAGRGLLKEGAIR